MGHRCSKAETKVSPVVLNLKRCMSLHRGQGPTILTNLFWLRFNALVVGVTLAFTSLISSRPSKSSREYWASSSNSCSMEELSGSASDSCCSIESWDLASDSWELVESSGLGSDSPPLKESGDGSSFSIGSLSGRNSLYFSASSEAFSSVSSSPSG